ncbi:MAG TPA: hydantoinase/oxoprolinase family protein [Spirochaetota bacterium]|nr:hydantoinase/oxoprolinase family protein [Spirochaetota bacterium]HPJ41953.1 hydantoinase/oxoprolinase family protein [Spirochaetota bacterium]HPR37334.1 hydantoinase/oxoprolinase family protein [Spirochaetota bacterium]
MLLGIDVGGTHTDAVLIDEQKGIISKFKVKTDKRNLLDTVINSLKEVTSGFDVKKITNVNLSTTLSTNAIVENRLEKTALFLSSGPGINPSNFCIGKNTYIINGSIDHRGNEVASLDTDYISKALRECRAEGIKVFAAATKFSTRNKSHETEIAEAIGDAADYVTMGHELSSQLSFPRRAATAYYNSAVWRIYNSFIDAIIGGLKNIGIDAPVNILKADGGTMPLAVSRKIPVESILSGPAASIMGIIALSSIKDDSVILDIGGTTTDIAIFAAGSPLLDKEGTSLDGIPTLVRSLQNRSIGIGGDSVIKIINGEIIVGPEREGPCLADGGDVPALVDALNYRGIIKYMDTARSSEGIRTLAEKSKLSPDDISEKAVKFSIHKIRDEINRILEEINQKPVYTIHEMVHGHKIVPKKMYLIGGPAHALSSVMSDEIEILVPENYDVANAIGAALARTTFETELFADTGKGTMLMPNIGIEEKVARKYSLEEAEADAKKYAREYLEKAGYRITDSDISIIESSSFRMINDYYASGNDIRVKCQVKPGVVMHLHK